MSKDINLKTFSGITNIFVDDDVPCNISFKIPSNLIAIVENTTKRIQTCEEIIDGLIVPSIIQADYERTLVEFNIENDEVI